MKRVILFDIILVILLKINLIQASKKQNIVKNCVMASMDLAKLGDGSTPSSCMACDPTLPTCYGFCQALIDKLYYFCDDVCLPDGYYFDPGSQLKGCWPEVIDRVKIKVERCGCNTAAASRVISNTLLSIISISAGVFILLHA